MEYNVIQCNPIQYPFNNMQNHTMLCLLRSAPVRRMVSFISYHDQDLLLIFITIIDSRKIQTFIYSWVFVMEFSPQQISGLFDLLPWTWAGCPGWWGELVVLREMRRECSCSLLSDRITHQLHVSLVFMQHVNYRCDPYKLFPEQPINCWGVWLKKALANQASFDTSNIRLTHPAKSIRALNA